MTEAALRLRPGPHVCADGHFPSGRCCTAITNRCGVLPERLLSVTYAGTGGHCRTPEVVAGYRWWVQPGEPGIEDWQWALGPHQQWIRVA